MILYLTQTDRFNLGWAVIQLWYGRKKAQKSTKKISGCV